MLYDLCVFIEKKNLRMKKVVEMGENMKEGRNDKTFYVILIDFFVHHVLMMMFFVSFCFEALDREFFGRWGKSF